MNPNRKKAIAIGKTPCNFQVSIKQFELSIVKVLITAAPTRIAKLIMPVKNIEIPKSNNLSVFISPPPFFHFIYKAIYDIITIYFLNNKP